MIFAESGHLDLLSWLKALSSIEIFDFTTFKFDIRCFDKFFCFDDFECAPAECASTYQNIRRQIQIVALILLHNEKFVK